MRGYYYNAPERPDNSDLWVYGLLAIALLALALL
jgi:hypothetical protein